MASPAAPIRRLSGLQKDVLALYRSLLRSVYKKYQDQQDIKTAMVKVVSKEFRSEAKAVDKHDFRLIEHKIRHGYKQKKILEMPGFSYANVVVKNTHS
jgi:succinate dehydrogenase assembly factor 1